VQSGKDKMKKNSGKSVMVRLDKMTNRDNVKLYQGSVGEAYANIKRENDKADYIKKLLMQA